MVNFPKPLDTGKQGPNLGPDPDPDLLLEEPKTEELKALLLGSEKLPARPEIRGSQTRYNSIENLKICDLPKGPPINEDYLTKVKRVLLGGDYGWVLPHHNREQIIAGYHRAAQGVLFLLTNWEQVLVKEEWSEQEQKDLTTIFPKADLKSLRWNLISSQYREALTEDVQKILSSLNSKFVNPTTDEDLIRTQVAHDNLKYVGETSAGLPNVSQLSLCRSQEREADGGYRIWAYANNTILDRKCETTDALHVSPLQGIQLEPHEIILLVWLGKLSQAEYCVAQDLSGKFFLNPDAADGLQQDVLKDGPFSKERAAAIHRAVEDIKSNWLQRNYPALIIGGIAAQTAVSLAMYHIFRQSRDIARQNMELLKRLHDEKIDPTKFLNDVTEEAKNPAYPRLVGEEADLRKMSRITLRPEKRHIIISGPAGAGKTETVKRFLQRVATGKIPHLAGRRLFLFDTAGFERAGAKYVGKIGDAFMAMMEKVNEQSSIVYFPEAATLAGLGTSEGREVDLRDYLKPYMERGSNIIFVFDTNEPEKLTEDSAIARRVAEVKKQAPTFKKAQHVFAELQRDFTNGFHLAEGTPDTILHLAGAAPGGRIDGAIDLIQDLIADAAMEGKTTGTITGDTTIEFFAREHEMSLEAVKGVIALSKIGIEQGVNPERLGWTLKAFVKNYAEGTTETIFEASGDEKEWSTREILEALGRGEKLDFKFVHIDNTRTVLRISQPEAPKVGKGPGGGGNGGEGGSPPAAAGGGDGGGPGPARTGEGEENRPAGDTPGDRTVNRTRLVEVKAPRGILDISLGVKGFASIVAPFVGLDVAEHYGVITSGQKTVIIGALIAGSTYLDRMTPAHLAILYAPFELGRMGTEAGMEAVGVRRGSLGHKVGGTVGAFAAAEGFVTAVGKGAGAKTLGEAHVLGRQVLHDSLIHISRNVRESLVAARQVVPVLRQARNIFANAAPGAFMMAPAVAVLKGGAAVMASSAAVATAATVSAIAAVGGGAAYLTYRSGVGEKLADKMYSKKIGQWIYKTFLD